MKRTGRGKNIAATTKDMRDVAREAHKRGLNRQMKPAQFKLLDPRGTHIVSPQFFHDRADGKLVDMHIRCHVHMKLIGKGKAVEIIMDFPESYILDHISGQEKLELMDRALEYNAVERMDDYVAKEEPKRELVSLDSLTDLNEATPNADNMD